MKAHRALFGVFLLFAFGVAYAFLAQAKLSWQAPTEMTDGEALYRCDVNPAQLPQADQDRITAGECLAGYRVYWGYKPGSYLEQFDVESAAALSAAIDLQARRKNQSVYIVMTAVTADGVESDYSNEVVYLAKPKATVRRIFMWGSWKVCADGWRVLVGKDCP